MRQPGGPEPGAISAANTDPQIYVDLIHAAQAQGIPVFLGAGASIASGAKSGQALAQSILAQASGAVHPASEGAARFLTAHPEAISLAGILDETTNSPEQRKIIIRSYVSGMEPSDGYCHLAILLSYGILGPVVFSTNFDTMLEEAFRICAEQGRLGDRHELVVRSSRSARVPLTYPSPDQIQLVKLHGSIDSDETLLLTAGELRFVPAPFARYLSRCVAERGLLVLGYAGEDTGVASVLLKTRLRDRPVFWFDPNVRAVSASRLSNFVGEAGGDIHFGDSTFDQALSQIFRFGSCIARQAFSQEMDRLWGCVKLARTSVERRSEALSTLTKGLSSLPEVVPSDEVSALRDILAYETHKSGETYRLEEAINRLIRSVELYRKLLPAEETAVVELALADERLNLFLLGGPLPGSRREQLNEVVQHCEFLFGEIPNASHLARARTALVAAEAYKEHAMIALDPKEQRSFVAKSQEWLEACRNNAARVDDQKTYLEGCAVRHEAVLHEVLADAEPDASKRRELYDKWLALSQDAVELLTSCHEDGTRAYALINQGSGLVRLSEYLVHIDRSMSVQATSRAIGLFDEALVIFEALGDRRGEVWDLVHLCEALHLQLRVTDLPEQREPLLLRMETSANRAVAVAKWTADHLALGIGYMKLGIALLLMVRESEEYSSIRLARAQSALELAAWQLTNTGYSRGTSQAYYYLALCHEHAGQMREADEIESLRSMIRALVEAALGSDLWMGRREDLKSMSELMRQAVERDIY